MGSMREIRARIKSVKSTQQITKTMKMVASAKLRRTQNGLNGIRSFADRSRHILGELMAADVVSGGSALRRVGEADQIRLLCAVRGQPRAVRRV